MSPLPIVVVKVGGSLLDWAELPARLRQWLGAQPPAIHVLIAGGGEFCEIIRRLDRMHGLDEVQSHWLCVDLLSTSANVLAHLLTELPLVESLPQIKKMRAGASAHPAAVVFDPREFLVHEEMNLPGTVLKASWDVTSDSIAARVAECLAADELVLVKSGDPPANQLASCAAGGFVDPFFATAAGGLRRVSCVNLRSDPHAVELSRGQ